MNQVFSWATLLLVVLGITGCNSATAAKDQRAEKNVDAEATATRASAKAAPKSKDIPRSRTFGQDWASFLGPNRDSKSPETGILTKWPDGGPRIIWDKRLGTGYGMPVISEGRLFQFHRVGDRATLTCLASETGEELWNFDYESHYSDNFGYDNGPRCSPVVDDDRVYLFGAEGMLHCVAVGDGTLLWKVDTTAEFGVVQNFFGVGSTPIVEEDLLIAQIGGSTEDSRPASPDQLDVVRGNGSGVVAFDKMTGKVKYKITDELASYACPITTTINGRRWCFVFARGGLVGFEPSTGKVDFHYPWRAEDVFSVNASTPVVVEDLVFISECYGPGSSLLKVRPGSCDVVWSDPPGFRAKKAMQTHWNTPVHHEGYLYASSGRHPNNAELCCVELKTGKVMWSQPDLSRASLLYVDGHLVCQCEYGQLLLIKATPERFVPVAGVMLSDPSDPSGMRPLLEYPAWAAPILSHGLLYVRGKERLACLELIPAQK